jgi:hypothetical protein
VVLVRLNFNLNKGILDKELIMEKNETKHRMIRQLRKDDKIPYDLLLLADETLEAIDKYIFGSDIYVLEKENKIIAEYVLHSINKNEVEIKNMAASPMISATTPASMATRQWYPTANRGAIPPSTAGGWLWMRITFSRIGCTR